MSPGFAPFESNRAHQRSLEFARQLPLGVVLLIALVESVGLYQNFLVHHRELWTSPVHDRNAHYWLSLSIAIDLRHADVPSLIHDLHKARVWPPLHAILSGLAQAVGGLDERIAIIPNLAAWVGTVLFAFLTARRMARRGGNLAGVAAAAFVLASPAHRAYACDVMLESLGACLTLATLYLFLRTEQEPRTSTGRWLAISLSLLFFEKYNYWLLVVLPLALSALYLHRDRCRSAWEQIGGWGWLRARLRREVFHPLNLLTATLVLVSLLIATGHLQAIHIGNRTLELRTPVNIASAAAAFFGLRLFMLWRAEGWQYVAALPNVPRRIVFWHVLPVFAWLLWPQRIWNFFWFLSPLNEGENPSSGLISSIETYWKFATSDYHLGAVEAMIAVGLASGAMLQARRFRPGSLGVILCLVLSLALTLDHPNHKARFAHTWMPVLWTAAGAGLIQLAYTRRKQFVPQIRPLAAVCCVGALACLLAPGFEQPGHATEAGLSPGNSSTYEIADRYLPAVEGMDRLAILSNVPAKFFQIWPALRQKEGRLLIETDLRALDPATASDSELNQWLERYQFQAVVIVQIDGGPFSFPITQPGLERVERFLNARGECKKYIDSGDRWSVAVWPTIQPVPSR